MEKILNPNAHIVHTATDGGPVTLQRNRSGHFKSPGEINGEPVTFFTGYPALPMSPFQMSWPMGWGSNVGAAPWFNTANGREQGNLTQLDEVTLGGINIRNVQGSISPGMENHVVLLGMSFLHLLNIEIRSGEMGF